MSQHGVHIGNRQVWGGQAPFRISDADRRQHLHVIGKTGTGKSTLLRHMMLQDIEAGAGVAVIDPHGDLAVDLLDRIPPSRIRDVIYFNPADREHPLGFNLLRAVPEARRHLVASGVVSAFKSVWRDSWGPRLEYILYGCIAALTCVENATVLGAQRMLFDGPYRDWVLRQVDDPMVRAFWEHEFGAYGRRLLAEAIAPLQNKIGQLVMSPLVRNIVGQVSSRLDLATVMDDRRILIVNLSKGELGEDKANLLGSMLITAFHLAALSRTTVSAESRQNFHLYVDEFQSFATESFASMLSEARKYGLCLTLSHQYIGQLADDVRDALLGNVGSTVAFRLSEADARVLCREFGGEPPLSFFTDLGNFEARVRTLVQGVPGETFLARMTPPDEARHGRAAAIIARSRAGYATPRHMVEDRIDRWMSRIPDGGRRVTGRKRT